MLVLIRFILVLLGLVFACTFTWYESTNHFIEIGKSWRLAFGQLIDGGQSYHRMPLSHVQAMRVLLRHGLDRCNTSLMYQTSTEDDKGGLELE